MTDSIRLDRRSFISLTLTAGGALLLEFPLTAHAANPAAPPAITGFFEIGTDHQLYILLNRHEMGQGLSDGLRTLFAEELGTAPERIRVRLLSSGPTQANALTQPLNTGGSASTRTSWVPVRQAAAYCRDVLLKAAALTVQAQAPGRPLPRFELRDGWILGPREPLRFAAVLGKVTEAARAVDPKRVRPTPPPWRYIGEWKEPAWLKEKVTGVAKYGFDRACELVASIERPDRFGAELAGMNEQAALAVAGVTAVIPLQSGVAVVAKHTWAALQGRKALAAQWKGGAELSSVDLGDTLAGLLDKPGLSQAVVTEGAAPTTAPALERVYRLPFLAHTPMEPLACTVSVGSKRCYIQAGTQRPDTVRMLAASITGLPMKAIQLDDELSGGSFGRRLGTDFIAEALELGVRLRKPVKVVWTREDLLASGQYRPPAVIRMRGHAGPRGQLVGLQHQVVSTARLNETASAPPARGDLTQYLKNLMAPAPGKTVEYSQGVVPSKRVGESAVEGVRQCHYRLPYRRVEHVPVDLPVPVGYWRSVGNSLNIFAQEVFIDEWATHHRLDPLSLRLQLLPSPSRLRSVLERVAELAGWPQRGPDNPMGLACFAGYDTFVATVVRLQPGATEPGHIAEIVCSVDCGIVVNPDNVRAQIEGALTMGLSAALGEQVVLEQGRVQTRNFDTYPLLDISRTPSLYIEVVPSEAAPGGIGEPCLPAVAPALVNAWRLRSGQNIASLPVSAVSKVLA
ncbi:MAG: xanthine dehydrogenase family protein molybdopterin-binding subunit [Gammaproteobacteria bacterium]|nr:xanthine dehydrogenase family protein molybdopterin-binding subunit [Gammaproteobacteria bacterium]